MGVEATETAPFGAFLAFLIALTEIGSPAALRELSEPARPCSLSAERTLTPRICRIQGLGGVNPGGKSTVPREDTRKRVPSGLDRELCSLHCGR